MVEVTDIDPSEVDDGLETEDDIEDETFVERICALSEMFPTSLRNVTYGATSMTTQLVHGAYKFSRSALWIVGTSFVILALPAVMELERVNMEEAERFQQRQMLLGPGAMQGQGGAPPNMMPPMK